LALAGLVAFSTNPQPGQTFRDWTFDGARRAMYCILAN
jgi:hypothetical protein